eukprot:3174226-Lingulodinium_polyedra.AAC.1
MLLRLAHAHYQQIRKPCGYNFDAALAENMGLVSRAASTTRAGAASADAIRLPPTHAHFHHAPTRAWLTR